MTSQRDILYGTAQRELDYEACLSRMDARRKARIERRARRDGRLYPVLWSVAIAALVFVSLLFGWR